MALEEFIEHSAIRQAELLLEVYYNADDAMPSMRSVTALIANPVDTFVDSSILLLMWVASARRSRRRAGYRWEEFSNGSLSIVLE